MNKQLCQHIFCDNRISRNIARHKVSRVSPVNGFVSVTLVCDSHLPDIASVMSDSDTVEAL